ncbi:MAG: hypothetical protein IKV59_06200 [Lachnospiraceae bacterium]|nr:hypothetical protein [Lachnospiraceae bacterium]
MTRLFDENFKDLKVVKRYLFGLLGCAILSLVPGVVSGGEGDLAELGLLLCIVFLVGFVYMYIVCWKCPYCGKHLDKLIITQKCKRCGKRIDK